MERIHEILQGASDSQALPATEFDDKYTCSICYRDYNSGNGPETGVPLSCGHSIGSACIHKWLSVKSRLNGCPICHAKFFRPLQSILHPNHDVHTQTTSYLNRHLLALQGGGIRNADKLRISYARMLKDVDHDERLLRAAGSKGDGPELRRQEIIRWRENDEAKARSDAEQRLLIQLHDGILHPATELARSKLPATLEGRLALLRPLATVKDFRAMHQRQIWSTFSRIEAAVPELCRALTAQLNAPRWADMMGSDPS